MNILLSALICGGIAGFGALLAWLAHKHLGLSAKGQQIVTVVALVLGLALIRVLPVDAWARSLQSGEATQSQADAELLAVPAFKALHDGYPMEYAAMRDTAIQSLAAGETKIQTINRIRPRLLEILGQQMEKTSDETMGRQLAFVLKQARFLQASEPQYCHELLNTPGQVSFDPNTVFPRDMANEEMVLMADILRETANLPPVATPPLDEVKFQPLAERAFGALSTEEVAALTEINFEVVNATTAAQKSASCTFALELMEQIIALPPADAARLFRSLIAEGNKL